MTSIKNTRFIAALAVFAMMFAGFGAIITADDNDAATKAYVGDSIVIKDSMELGLMDADGDLYMVIAADLDLGKDGLTPRTEEKDKYTYHLSNFAKAIDAYYSDAVLTFIIPYDVPRDKGIEDIVPASFLVYFTDGQFVLTVEKESDFAILSTIEKNYVGAEMIALGTDVAMTAAALVAEDMIVMTTEELAEAIEGAEAIIEAFYADYSSPEEVQTAIDAAIAKYIADHPVKEDNTTLWMCIAAVLGIAAVALGAFLVVALVKAKKEGRRFI